MGGGGRLFEAGRLLNFSTFRVGAYSRWALIRGWALNRINTVFAMRKFGANLLFRLGKSLSTGEQPTSVRFLVDFKYAQAQIRHSSHMYDKK